MENCQAGRPAVLATRSATGDRPASAELIATDYVAYGFRVAPVRARASSRHGYGFALRIEGKQGGEHRLAICSRGIEYPPLQDCAAGRNG